MSKKYLRAKDVASKTGLALQTIYQYTSEKRIPFIRFGSRTTLYEETAIEHWIENRYKLAVKAMD
ncbi:MAG: AlpA family transcriptional regulator [Bacteroidetes bacterium]|jgi:excisionase family DNA binding protein|nr:MAG: AlpA family transcriptional regulator [Bacteroidota bacterium]